MRKTKNSMIGEILLAKYNNPDWSPGKIIEYLKSLPKIKESAIPKERTIFKILSDFAENRIKVRGESQDKPWFIDTLDEFPISAEALPFVMKCWRYNVGFERFSIRDAKWVGRLYKIYQDWNENNEIKKRNSLFSMARSMSGLELKRELAGDDFDQRWEILKNMEALNKIITGDEFGSLEGPDLHEDMEI